MRQEGDIVLWWLAKLAAAEPFPPVAFGGGAIWGADFGVNVSAQTTEDAGYAYIQSLVSKITGINVRWVNAGLGGAAIYFILPSLSSGFLFSAGNYAISPMIRLMAYHKLYVGQITIEWNNEYFPTAPAFTLYKVTVNFFASEVVETITFTIAPRQVQPNISYKRFDVPLEILPNQLLIFSLNQQWSGNQPFNDIVSTIRLQDCVLDRI